MTYKAPAKLNSDLAFNRLESGKQVIFNIKLTKSEAGSEGDDGDWQNKTNGATTWHLHPGKRSMPWNGNVLTDGTTATRRILPDQHTVT